MAPVDGELGQHREPAQRDEVGRRRVRQRGCGPGRRGRRRTGNGRRIRVDRKPLRHPRDAGAGGAVARWRNWANLRVVGCLCQVRDESYRQWERTVRLANTVG